MKKGLTLIELLITISLLAVLLLLFTGLVVGSQLQKGRDAKRKIDFQALNNSLDQYYDSSGCFPEVLTNCRGSLLIGSEVYIQTIPCDPKTQENYTYVSDNTSCSEWFKLYTNLENTKDPRIEEVGCTYGCGPDCAFNYGIASPNTSLDKCTPSVTPSPTPIQFVCAPGGGQSGSCEAYENPGLSECPKIYPDDPTCNNECTEHENKCKNASGKYTP